MKPKTGVHLSGVVWALMLSGLFLLFINGNVGRAFQYVILIASGLSIITLTVSRNRFTVTVEELSGVAKHGEKVEFKVTVKKKGFCFVPFMEICLNADTEIHLRTSLVFRKTVTMSGSFRTSHSGLNKLSLTGVVLGDFLGITRMSVPMEQNAQIAVMPKIIDYDGPEISPSLLPSEEEETEEGITVLSGGMPGYEHREYVPGDSPRKVNYKLSAKRQKLMVRLDESNGYAATNLYISENALPVCCDKAFALAQQLIIRGGTVKITHKNQSFSAQTPETLDKMREWLAFREFSDYPEPALDTPPADANVVFSGNGEIRIAKAV